MRDASSLTTPGSDASIATPICDNSDCIVRTSLRRGTLRNVTGSGDSKAAHNSGSAAFFAPEARISPRSGVPPVILSLSIAALRPLRRGERLHRQRVDLLAHAVAECCVNELVLLDARQSGKGVRDDDGFEVRAVTAHFDVLGGQSR